MKLVMDVGETAMVGVPWASTACGADCRLAAVALPSTAKVWMVASSARAHLFLLRGRCGGAVVFRLKM